jgi:GT2 family glycosyltransferase
LVPHLANRVAKHYYLIPFEIRREGPASWVTSAGMSCPRSLVEKVGGFDEEFDLSMGFADRDFGIRLVEAGGEVVLANGIPMMVDDSESQGSWRDRVLRRFDREHPGQTHPNWLKLIKKYPELAK